MDGGRLPFCGPSPTLNKHTSRLVTNSLSWAGKRHINEIAMLCVGDRHIPRARETKALDCIITYEMEKKENTVLYYNSISLMNSGSKVL